MRIAFSNIAWDTSEDAAVAALLRNHGIDAIDVAPSKYFTDLQTATQAQAQTVKQWWQDQGIELTGMQALLFGTTGLNMFGDTATQNAMLQRLGAVCRIGGWLGATKLVFGSPKNRDRTGVSDAQTQDTAVSFFRQLGQMASDHGVMVCLEPNPTRYHCNFMTNTDEAAQMVRAVNHPSIRMQLDTGTITINQESAAAMVSAHADVIGHVHASEPDLRPLGDAGCDHTSVAQALRSLLPDHVVTIEMVATSDEPHLASMARALHVAQAHYSASHGDTTTDATPEAAP
jgi:D-psicose/D-tagatose/L-ribulose 3-epimerase